MTVTEEDKEYLDGLEKDVKQGKVSEDRYFELLNSFEARKLEGE